MKPALTTYCMLFLGLPVLALALGFSLGRVHAAAVATGPGSALSIPQDQLLQPEALAKILTQAHSQSPVILQVGSHVLFEEAHIPGALYAGPGSQSAGLENLQHAVAALPHDRSIVLYCGCCPWDHCPNIAPAFEQMHTLGFTQVKVLYLARNFGADWIDKGYAVEPKR